VRDTGAPGATGASRARHGRAVRDVKPAQTIDADAKVGGSSARARYLRRGSSEVYWSVEPWSDTYRELP
jgi:hypothetical protein